MTLPRGLVALFVVLSISLALNVVLGLKLRHASAQAEYESVRTGVQVGAQLAGVPLVDVNGVSKSLAFLGRRPMVLYVFAPNCKYCTMNLPNVQALAHARGDSYDFVGLSNTPVGFSEYVAKSTLSATLYVLDGERMKDDNPVPVGHFGSTPQLVVLSPDGKVEEVWIGAFQPRAQAEVERYFGLRLPGLVALNANGS